MSDRVASDVPSSVGVARVRDRADVHRQRHAGRRSSRRGGARCCGSRSASKTATVTLHVGERSPRRPRPTGSTARASSVVLRARGAALLARGALASWVRRRTLGALVSWSWARASSSAFIVWADADQATHAPADRQPAARHAQARHAADLRRAGRLPVRAGRRHQHRDRGPVPAPARSLAAVVASAVYSAGMGLLGGILAGVADRRAAGGLRDPLPGQPGRARRRADRARHRPDRLPARPDPRRPTRQATTTRPILPPIDDPACCRHPGDRADAVRRRPCWST